MVVALGLGRSGEVVSSADLKAQGDLFTYQGQPFTGTAHAESKGRKTEAEFWEGRLHGRYRSWHANGKIESEAYFENGRREGLAKLWNEKGQILQETRFREGLAEGDAKEWYPNGNLERRTGWQKGKRSGIVETWYENGRKKGVGSFQEGERNGTFLVWWPNGKKEGRNKIISKGFRMGGGWNGMRMEKRSNKHFLKKANLSRALPRRSLEPAGRRVNVKFPKRP